MSNLCGARQTRPSRNSVSGDTGTTSSRRGSSKGKCFNVKALLLDTAPDAAAAVADAVGGPGVGAASAWTASRDSHEPSCKREQWAGGGREKGEATFVLHSRRGGWSRLVELVKAVEWPPPYLVAEIQQQNTTRALGGFG